MRSAPCLILNDTPSRESFTRQIRVLDGDLVETVAVQQARFDGMDRNACALDD
jgi:hypothetical protein